MFRSFRAPRSLRAALSALVLSSGLVLTATPAHADATITVTTTANENGFGPNCSLREAIVAANTDADFGGCVAAGSYGADTIVLAPNANYILATVDNDMAVAPGTTVGPTGLPVVTTEITIEGNGATIRRAAGAPEFRIFTVLGNFGTVNGSGLLTLNKLTITGGVASAPDVPVGGGIANFFGGLSVNLSTIAGNTAITTASSDALGGGVFSVDDGGGSGSLDIETSTISGNTADGASGGFAQGGGIWSNNQTAILSSTISGNTATSEVSNAWGGGIAHQGGTATISNSTVSGNLAHSATAQAIGGGISSTSSLMSLTASTIVENTVDGAVSGFGSGLALLPGGSIVELQTIIGENAGGDDCYLNGIFDEDDLVGGNLTTHLSCRLSVGTTLTLPGTLGLGPLQNNGGLPAPVEPPYTHALLPGSPAIDAFADTAKCVAADQRGVFRPQGVACDIGAFELQSAALADSLTLFPSGGPVVPENPVGTRHTVTATVSLNMGEVGGALVTFRVTGANNLVGSVTTDAVDGEAAFTYIGTNPGLDTIHAEVPNGVGAIIFDTGPLSQKEWLPVDIAVSPAEATNPVGADHVVTATVTLSEDPVVDAVLTFVVVSGPNAGLTGTTLTDPGGIADFHYTSTQAGTDTIQVCVGDPPGTFCSDTVTKTWVGTGGGGGGGGGGGSGSDRRGRITVIERTAARAGTSVVMRAAPDVTFGFHTKELKQKTFRLGDDDDREFKNLRAGTYTIAQDKKDGWKLDRIVCHDPTKNTKIVLDTRRAQIKLKAGEHVTCAFINSRK